MLTHSVLLLEKCISMQIEHLDRNQIQQVSFSTRVIQLLHKHSHLERRLVQSRLMEHRQICIVRPIQIPIQKSHRQHRQHPTSDRLFSVIRIPQLRAILHQVPHQRIKYTLRRNYICNQRLVTCIQLVQSYSQPPVVV